MMIKFRKNIALAALSVVFIGFNANAQESGGGLAKGKYTALVNPFIGTAPLLDTKITGYTPPPDWRVWAGLVFPGSSVPNAMVQLSPITKYHSGAGYEYEDTSILGFTHTNKGHWNLCNIPLLPVPEGASFPYKSSFSHDQEKASPAYYEVYLKEYNVQVKLTSTLHCGVHEYAFKNNKGRKVLFDLGRANNNVDDWQLQQEGKDAVTGFQRTGNEKIYFYATFSSPIATIDTKDLSKSKGYSLVNIKDGDAKPVTVKIALSFVSVENAKENLKAEVLNKIFNKVFEEGSTTWENLLSKIQVKGGNKQQEVMFYSMLYRSFLWPALRSDVNGQFLDEAGKVRKENYRYYTLPSLWDDYRNKLVLL
ncbi:MAG: glycoside hydrolase domain-containing protein, partial [Flavobacterium sp.]